MTELEYREYPALNYSLLKQLEFNPRLVLESRQVTESDSLLAGSVLDCLLTDADNFDEKFIVPKFTETPSGQVLSFSKGLVGTDSTNFEEESKRLYKELGIKSPNTYEAFLEKWKKSGGEAYLQFLQSTKDKKVVDPFMYENCKNASNVLKVHPFTEGWFNKGFEQEILYQTPIIFKLNNGLEGKALLDLIKIDHLERTIYPGDLKSMSDYLSAFLSVSFKKYRYDLQASYYTEAVRQWGAEKYPDYKIANFTFVVLSFAQINNPLCFKVSDFDLQKARLGGYDVNGKKFSGWEQLVSDYQWHKDNDKWDYPRAVYENKGLITTDMYVS